MAESVKDEPVAAAPHTVVRKRQSARSLFPSLGEIWAASIVTETVNPKLPLLLSWKVFIAGGALAWGCIAFFMAAQEWCVVPYAVANGYVPIVSAEADLKILDRREGYDTALVVQLLGWYGAQGRLAYVLVEVVDMLLFQVAYRLCAVVALNNVALKAGAVFPAHASKFSLLSRVPLYLAKVDVIEDVLQIVLVLSFELNHKKVTSMAELGWFIKLVKISSTVNRLKWMLAKILGGVFLLVLTIYRLGAAATRPKSPIKPKSD